MDSEIATDYLQLTDSELAMQVYLGDVTSTSTKHDNKKKDCSSTSLNQESNVYNPSNFVDHELALQLGLDYALWCEEES
jgi:hypothetical protein